MIDRLLSIEEWETEFQPIQREDGEGELFYETYNPYLKDLKDTARTLAHTSGSEMHQHIWTRVDGDDGRLILLNGWHAVNRIDYCLSLVPWGDGTSGDKDVYIEVTYEDPSTWE